VQYKGRIYAVGVVILFNILRYFYYHQYLELPFKLNFFILTSIFLTIAWCAGRQFDRAKYLSENDPLTKTYNRRTVEQYFQKYKQKSKSRNHRIGVVMIDLNDFKEVNDTLGHHKGDQLLKEFASFLKDYSGNNGLVARWGGDEFSIVVPNIPANFESTYVEGLQKELRESHLMDSYKIGASVGYAIYPAHGETFETLIKAADLEMYKSKDSKY